LRKLGWTVVFGTSGTVQATAALLRELNASTDGISRSGLEELVERIVEHENVSELSYDALSAQRAQVYMGGLAILVSVFEALGVEHMRVSDGALREGLLYDMLGRLTDEDARVRTVRAMQQRYHVDLEQAERTETLALRLLEQAAGAWNLSQPLVAESLRWAARLHEVGLAIAHAQYHKHGGYLLEHADMAGFSRHEQTLVARLVRTHRRKILMDSFSNLPVPWPQVLPRVAVLLRLAVLLNRSRTPTQVPEMQLEIMGSDVNLRFPAGWLDQHPLTRADLEGEVEYLKAVDLRLSFT
jgi:exopolyphosphatase/guanosine-5'-triphosphate,3'-diphosphate pyrophosphatase